MKIIKNEKLIKRNGRIAQWSTIAGLVILAAGMYISFKRPELFSFSLLALLLGFTCMQISMYFGNRFGRSPRPDEKLDAGLKGLPGDFVIYHYITPAAHLLVGPVGLWSFLLYHQRGRIFYRNNRWRLSGGGFLQGYLRIFGQEGLGRPELEAAGEISSLRKFLAKHLDEAEIPEIQAMLVFTSENVEIQAEGASLRAMKLRQLKDFMRQKAKNRVLSTAQIERIVKIFPDTK
jgi:hypothetical protein